MGLQAPFFATLAEGPAVAQVEWLTTGDGQRLRAAYWPCAGAKGTVLIFPGRSEYIEKYGRAARDLAARGYACVTLDWRGQGLADRAYADRMIGHVDDFAAYQRDADALLDWVASQSAPGPLFLLGHSMGGCIGLRAALRGLPFRALAFSAPMWGISLAAWMRPLASVVAQVSVWMRQAHRYAPMTGGTTYVLSVPFAGNVLTTDNEMWDYMRHQMAEAPDLALGGPSMGWLHAALRECAALSAQPCPALPCVTALGTAEKVVDTAPIHLRMAAWPGGRLDLYPGAEHEVMMEQHAHRARFFEAVCDLFDAQL